MTGDSAVLELLLPMLLLDAPERARLDLVSRFCCFGEMEEVWALEGSGGSATEVEFLPLLLLPFLSEEDEDEESSGGDDEAVRRREPTAVSDLYRGRRVGGTVSVAAGALTAAETECDRRRGIWDGVAGGCVVRGGDMGKVMVASESEGW
jgi:hypothetical protein